MNFFLFYIERFAVNLFTVLYVFFNRKKEFYLFNSPHGLSDNAYYLMLYFLQKNKKCIWILTGKESAEQISFLKVKYKNLIFIKRNAFDGFLFLFSARCLFVTHSYKSAFRILPKQITVINLWHGFPYKKMGFDATVDKVTYQDGSNVYERYNYIIAPSNLAKKFFMTCFNLPEERILPYGQPRVDFLYQHTSSSGFSNNSKKVFLYAPTFRDSGINLPLYINFIENFIEKDLGKLICRFHPKERDAMYYLKSKYEEVEFSNVCDVNLDLLRSDILVSDYSSVIFDYIVLNRPVILYSPDDELYSESRNGYYFDINDYSTIFCRVFSIDEFNQIDLNTLQQSAKVLNKQVFNSLDASENLFRLVERLI